VTDYAKLLDFLNLLFFLFFFTKHSRKGVLKSFHVLVELCMYF